MNNSRTWQADQAARAHCPPARWPQTMTKNLDDTMPYGKLKGWELGRICRLEPEYAHWLIDAGRLTATRAICDEIQKGYDHDAARLTAERGCLKVHRLLFVCNPVLPKQAPPPTT